jgi:hypothetical protein
MGLVTAIALSQAPPWADMRYEIGNQLQCIQSVSIRTSLVKLKSILRILSPDVSQFDHSARLQSFMQRQEVCRV